MNTKRIIKSFTIKGLFGTTNVNIPFKDNVMILIGENGIGKTKVLNILYYALSKKFERLIEYRFSSIIIEFEDNYKIWIDKSEIDKLLFEHPLVKDAVRGFNKKQFSELRDSLKQTTEEKRDLRSSLYKFSQIRELFDKLPISPLMLLSAIETLSKDKSSEFFTDTHKLNSKQIDIHLKGYQILYFPTFRRVEEKIYNLSYDYWLADKNIDDSRLVHFDMDDVDMKFIDIKKIIENQSQEGFSKITSEILSQLVKGLPVVDNKFLSSINQKDFDIILARVGNEITNEDKKKIKDIVAKKEMQDKDHSLIYILQQLIKIYHQQRELDDSIKTFRDVCNKYLVNKNLIYDESSIEIYIQLDNSSEKLPLSKLSLGEKQMISIFCRVYLDTPESKFIILIDEPELSLSIFWQREFLSDILKSGKCSFLLAATHSPFIFENDLDQYAIGLSEYMSPSQTLTQVAV